MSPFLAELKSPLVIRLSAVCETRPRGVADDTKVLVLDGHDVRTILIDPSPRPVDRPDCLARQGSTLYRHGSHSGQVARIKLQTGSVEYIDVAPPALTGYAVHGIAVRPRWT